MATLNCALLAQSIIRALEEYDNPFISWLGRINVIKMDVVPKILYLFQTLPVLIPTVFKHRLSGAIRSFLWNKKKVCIGRDTLDRSKNLGLALPDLDKYYTVSALARMVYWFHHQGDKLWVELDESLPALQLQSLPWVSPDIRLSPHDSPLSVMSMPTVWDTMIT